MTPASAPATPPPPARLGWWHEERQPRVFFPSLLVGVVVALFGVSFSALVFAGPLQPWVGAGLHMVLAGGAVGLAVGALGSSYPGSVLIPQDRTAPILAVAAAAITQVVLAPAVAAASVVVMVVVTALLTGLTLFLLGRLRLGNLMRFVPYSVMGGFLAGTGWLLLLGALTVMTGQRPTVDNLGSLFTEVTLLSWTPGLIFGLLLWVAVRWCRHPAVLPGLLLSGFCGFWLLLQSHYLSLAEAHNFGWLLNPLGDATEQLGPLQALRTADWAAVSAQTSTIVTIVFVSALSVLLNCSAIELVAHRDHQMNRELLTAGVANLLAGPLGGLVTFHSVSLSTLVVKMKTPRRVVGLTAAAVCLLALGLGTQVAATVPRPLLGGLLAFLGLSFLVEWVYDGYRRLPRGDYLVVLAILVTIGAAGFIQGVAVGIVLAVIQFAIRYSRVQTVRHELSGAEARSNVDRPPAHQRLLREPGQWVVVLQLEGYIFFGTSSVIVHRIQQRLATAGDATRYVLLDFRSVSGLDYSAVMSFNKLRQLASARGVQVVISHCTLALQRELASGGFTLDAGSGCTLQPDLDHALEWCEEQMLRHSGTLAAAQTDAMPVVLQDMFGADRGAAAAFMRYLAPCPLTPGLQLIAQGAAADCLYFIARGQVSVRLTQEGREGLRLRTMASGTVVGEMGVILNQRRGAEVVADCDGLAYRLDLQALACMEREAPAVAMAFQRYLLRQLAERITYSNRLLQRLRQ